MLLRDCQVPRDDQFEEIGRPCRVRRLRTTITRSSCPFSLPKKSSPFTTISTTNASFRHFMFCW
jgi:hypothetical protein